jgi:hypothetical protein
MAHRAVGLTPCTSVSLPFIMLLAEFGLAGLRIIFL